MYEGRFESHLTVAPNAATELLSAFRGAKYTRIELDRGVTPDQPMITVPGTGTFDDQRALTAQWIDKLREYRFRVTRVKIEASPENAGLPQTAGLPHGHYWEHHVKLVLDSLASVDAVRAIVVGHAAHVSRNARRREHASPRHERFVTQRCHDAGQPEARRRLAALVAELTWAGFRPVETEQEYVLLDTCPALDAGWL